MHKTCFFIGHHDAPESIIPDLLKMVEWHITEYGVSVFVVGGYGEFDRIAAEVVIQIKKEHPDVSLIRLRPYSITEAPVRVPKGFNGIFRPPGLENASKSCAIVRANHYMIENSDYLIAYVSKSTGNSHKLLKYAQVRETKGLMMIKNLAETED